MGGVRRIAILGRWTRRIRLEALEGWRSFLVGREVEVWVEEPFGLAWEEAVGTSLGWSVFRQGEEVAQVDAAIVIGGDGAFLDAARIVAPYEVPLLGVHAGRLGFLTPVPQEALIPATEALLLGRYTIGMRSLIAVASEEFFWSPQENFALNEVTFSKAITSEMVLIEVYLNGEWMNTYWADGLIVATPTGSTAYSLACGGPIVTPTCEVFILTPMAPHTLTVRPLVIPNDGVLTVVCRARSEQILVALDGRYVLAPQGTAFALRKADFSLRIIQLSGYSYFQTLRDRLVWGLDRREH